MLPLSFFVYNICYCSLVPRSSNGFCRCFAFQIGKICYHHCIIRHFQFRKCLPVNSDLRFFYQCITLILLLQAPGKESILDLYQNGYCSLVPRSSNGFCRCFAFQIGKICCHHCIIRHFQFRKCLPVNNNQFYTTRFAAPMIPASFPSAEVTMSAIYP